MTAHEDVTFIDFRVTSIDFAVKSDYHGCGRQQVRTEFRLRHERRDNKLQVFLAIAFNDEQAPFSIAVEGVGLFDLLTTMTDAEVEALYSNHCVMTIFPYLREVIADITRRAGFPPLHIPQVHFNQHLQQQRTSVPSHTVH